MCMSQNQVYVGCSMQAEGCQGEGNDASNYCLPPCEKGLQGYSTDALSILDLRRRVARATLVVRAATRTVPKVRRPS